MRRTRPLLAFGIPTALALLAIITFAPSLQNGFTNWDDEDYVRANPLIRNLDAAGLRAIFDPSNVVVGNWAPVTILSFGLDHALWELRPRGYHLTNILLHGLCTALLYALLSRLLGLGEPRRGRRAAVIAAGLFAIHPVQVESVAWVAERKNVLGMSLMLAAFLAWLRASGVRARFGWYALFMLLFVLSLLAKAQAVILPPLLVLHEWILRPAWKAPVVGRRARAVLLLLAFAAALAVGWLTLGAQGTAKQARPTGDILGAFATAPVLILHYVADLLLPMNRSAILRRSVFDTPWSPVPLAAWITVGAWTLAALRKRRSSPHFAFFSLWFLGALAPVLNFVPLPVLAADRYQYWAAPGLFALAGLGLDSWLRRTAPAGRRLGAALAAVAACLLLAHTVTWIPVWRDSISLWTAANRDGRSSIVVSTNLGSAHVLAGRSEEAIPHLLYGIRLKPNDPRLRLNLGVALLKLGRLQEAIAQAKAIVEIQPRSLKGWLLLGSALRADGHSAEAARAFEQALVIDPREPAAIANLRALRSPAATPAPHAGGPAAR